MLTGKGFIAGHTKAPPGQRAFAVVSCTDAGAAFLRSQQPLVLQLSGEMAQQERAAREAAAAAAAAAAQAQALHAQRDAVTAEEQRLFRVLQDVRKVGSNVQWEGWEGWQPGDSAGGWALATCASALNCPQLPALSAGAVCRGRRRSGPLAALQRLHALVIRAGVVVHAQLAGAAACPSRAGRLYQAALLHALGSP